MQNEEIKRRSRVVRIFPDEESCLRLTRAICSEQHEAWTEGRKYLEMDGYSEHKKQSKKKKLEEAA